MNQILITHNNSDKSRNKQSDINQSNKNNNYDKINKPEKIFVFKFQLIFSILLFLTFIVVLYFYLHSLSKKENLSNKLIDNYSIYKLYSQNTSEQEMISNNNLFGIIEIPKISIYYPIFSNLDENLLKISPCKLYGASPSEIGNICIAGHNYNNSLFFSNINLLKKEDVIIIYDHLGNDYSYNVFDNYEVEESNLSPIFDYPDNEKIVTLITCNNFNNNRIIIKAKQKI